MVPLPIQFLQFVLVGRIVDSILLESRMREEPESKVALGLPSVDAQDRQKALG